MAKIFGSRQLTLTVVAPIILAMYAGAHAQRSPERPLRVIVPFPSGSAPDTVTRIIGPQITTITGQPVIVDSRPGAAGTLATDLGAKAPPNGRTITFAVLGPVGLAPSLYSKLPYNPVTDFAPVTLIAFAPQILMVSPSAPFKSVKELIALARAKPGQLNYASAGSGTLPHLSAERFSRLADIRLVHVPYKGVAAALPDPDGRARGSRVRQHRNGAAARQGVEAHRAGSHQRGADPFAAGYADTGGGCGTTRLRNERLVRSAGPRGYTPTYRHRAPWRDDQNASCAGGQGAARKPGRSTHHQYAGRVRCFHSIGNRPVG